MQQNPWEKEQTKSGLVTIGSHRLWLSATGPPRAQNEPAVIIMTGLTSSILEWSATIRQLSRFVRTVCYERSGYGASDNAPSTKQPTSTAIATELELLLKSADIKPPYIIIAHSYAGITSREFVHLHRENLDDIAGMVFVDANTEETPATYPNPNVSAISNSLDTLRICYENCHKLHDTEWQALLDEESTSKHEQTARAEVSHYKDSAPALHDKGHLLEGRAPLLGSSPVSVIQADYAQDLQKIYDAGVGIGNGTEAQRSRMRADIANANAEEAEMQKHLLRLSTQSRFTFIPNCGHSIHMERPDVIIEHVRWILAQLGDPKSSS